MMKVIIKESNNETSEDCSSKGTVQEQNELEGKETNSQQDILCKNCLLQPIVVSLKFGEFEISIHKPTKIMLRELGAVFGETLPEDLSNIIIIPTCQKANFDLLGLSQQVAEEKDRLLESFVSLGKALRAVFEKPKIAEASEELVSIGTKSSAVQNAPPDQNQGASASLLDRNTVKENSMALSPYDVINLPKVGYWLDFCDPASGLPMFGEGSSIFPEVECFERLRKYNTSSAGGCKVILHPKWGTSIYPATIFADCPPEYFLQALESLK